MSEIYNSDLKGQQVDESVKSSLLTCATTTIRDTLDTNLFTSGKIIFVEDIEDGNGTSQYQKWNGSGWDIHSVDEVRVNDGGKILSENGTIELQFNENGDDKGLHLKGGQFEVGSPELGVESVFGFGDSYLVPYAFHCQMSNTSGLTITSATDVSDTLQSDSGSTTGLFGDDASGAYLLVGSEYPFGGAKSKVSIAGDIEPDNIISEYLFDSSPTWFEIPFMSTLSEFPYTSYADDLSGIDSSSFQWRFGFDPDNLPVPWSPVSLNINGVDYEDLYWGRIRVETTITQDVILEQLKLHTNRYEINADGRTEYFGRARYPRDLMMHWHLTEQLQGFSPSNENIDFASNLQLVFTDNEFSAGAVDGRGGYVVIPSGLDTSIPLNLDILWIPEGDGSGDVVYETIVSPKRVGDIMDTSTLAESKIGIVSLDGQIHELQRTTISFDISKLKPGEILGFGIKRLGSDASDTFGSSVSLINVRFIGYFWTP